jgi:hypothetical protein
MPRLIHHAARLILAALLAAPAAARPTDRSPRSWTTRGYWIALQGRD